jgi:hypothetical protein
MARPVGESVLRALVSEAIGDSGGPRVLAVAATPQWAGNEVLETDAGPVRIAPCISPLAVREVLSGRGDGDDAEVLVILTDRDEHELGQEVMARVWRQRLLRPSGWVAVKHLFRVEQVDSALGDARWLIDLLVDVAPPRGYPPPPSGFLDIGTAWRTFLRHGLRLDAEAPTLGDLLRWGQTDAARSALTGPAGTHLDRIAERLERDVGPAAHHILRLVSQGRGADLVPLGLMADVLWADGMEGDPAILTARVRFETPLGAKKPSRAMARDWGEAARRLVRLTDDRDDEAMVAGWLSRAETHLTDLDAIDLAVTSDVLPWAFTERLLRAGRVLSDALDKPDDDSLGRLVGATEDVRRHLLADREDDRDRVERLSMATRLIRRSVQGTPDRAEDVAGMAAAFASDGAWVDAAREALGHGETVSPLADAYARLIEQLDAERADRDRAFAKSLAGWTTVAPTSSEALLPVEQVLAEVVAPVARRAPVLLLVLDGLSYPESTRLFSDLRRAGWTEQGPDGQPLPRVVAALPTITMVSRTSLLTGRLTDGGQDVERSGFENHKELRDAAGGTTPRLYHKKDLKAKHGHIADEVRNAILDPSVRVVGVVVNAVDDHLDKGAQLRLAEGLRALRPLRPLLDAAVEAGRVVVIASDHGHVLENGSRVISAPGAGERWRPATEPPGEDEVLLAGPRVVLGGGKIIAPALERVRYMPAEKRGYHGGATPQEVLCPLGVFTPGGVALDGWEPLPIRRPAWWEKTFRHAGAVAIPRVRPPEPVVEPSGQGRLFTEEGEIVPATVEVEGWIGELLASPILAEQREAAGRQALDDESLATFLTILDSADGVAPAAVLADNMGLPPSRLRTKLEALRRMLNVDAYPVLSIEPDGTARLNRELLFTQFRLEA